VKAIVVIPSMEGIASAAIDVEPSGPGYEELERAPVLVVFALEPALPPAPLVQLVENDERGSCNKVEVCPKGVFS
jgi:hypothetical protein